MSGNGLTLNIRAYGMPQYKKKLQSLGISLNELDKPMKKAGQIAMAAVRSYPPYTGSWKTGKESFVQYRPGSKYRRTQHLQGNWDGKLTKGSKIVVRYSIRENKVEYAKFVQGNQQSRQHKPWWLTVEQWEPIIRPFVTEIFRDFMKDIAKKAR